MGDSDTKLTRRRVLGGLITVGAASAAAGAGTFALFSDDAQSSGNTVQAGTLELTPNSSGIANFDITGIKPGGAEQSHDWTLENTGNITGSLDVDVTVSGENDSVTSSSATPEEFAKAVKVDTLNYDGGLKSDIDGTTDPNNVFDSSSASSYTSLYNLANNASDSGDTNDLINLSDPGDETDFTIGLSLHEDAGNDFQGEGIDVTFTFMLNQQDSQ